MAVSAGDVHTCVLTGAGTVRCWGANEQGQLGNNTTTPSTSPVTVRMRFQFGRTVEIRTLIDIVGLVADLAHTCALRVNGQPFCWGRNAEGQIGDGSTSDHRLVATSVPTCTAPTTPTDAARSRCSCTSRGRAPSAISRWVWLSYTPTASGSGGGGYSTARPPSERVRRCSVLGCFQRRAATV